MNATRNRHRAGKRGFFAAALGVLLAGSAAVAQPTLPEDRDPGNAPPGVFLGIDARWTFDNAGTNPRFTEAVFSDPDYLNRGEVYSNGRIIFEVKTTAQLNALASPPPSPFTFTIDVTMTNDEGEEASGTLTFKTHYTRDPAAGSIPGQAGTSPALSRTEAIAAPTGTRTDVAAEDVFDDAGTNPRFTEAVFSTTDYYNVGDIENGVLVVEPKTEAQLNALASPPDWRFEVTVEATMTNDEGQTATGTLTFVTTYTRLEREE